MTWWHTIPTPPQSNEPHITVWLIALEQEYLDAARSLLNPSECARADRLIIEAPRIQYTLARAALRLILSHTLNALGHAATPRNLKFGAHHRNKPKLDPQRLDFNLSHSHNAAVLATGLHCNLGVDVEYHDPKRDLESLARTAFSPYEHEQFLRASSAQKARVFFQTWTRKEAYLKALGMGLAIELKDFCIEGVHPTDAQLRRAVHSGAEPDRWTLRGIPISAHYDVALAHDLPPTTPIEIRAFNWGAFLASPRTHDQ